MIHVLGVHSFLSSIDLGPEISSQACLFNQELCWDFTFLDSDMDRELAEEIIAQVASILEECSRPGGGLPLRQDTG